MPDNFLDNALHDSESRLDLWYPNPRRAIECAVAYDSLIEAERISAEERLANLTAHEFGHVLGLFDAYDYSGHGGVAAAWFFSSGVDMAEARLRGFERPGEGIDIMRSTNFGNVTSFNIEMMLWAWSRNALHHGAG